MIELVEVSRIEARAVCFTEFDVKPMMVRYLDASERFIIVRWGDGFLGVFGAARPAVFSGQGLIWFAESPLLAAHKLAFIRASRIVRDMFLAHYDELVGVSYNPSSIAWLRWTGAAFGPRLEDGAHPFVIRRATHG